jgi:hypothetical protein
MKKFKIRSEFENLNLDKLYEMDEETYEQYRKYVARKKRFKIQIQNKKI